MNETALWSYFTFLKFWIAECPFLLAAFISHSMSSTQLKYIFQHALPDLSGKTVVDVGSRLGCVLYAVSTKIGFEKSSTLFH
jgi:uncharacterized membrane protein